MAMSSSVPTMVSIFDVAPFAVLTSSVIYLTGVVNEYINEK